MKTSPKETYKLSLFYFIFLTLALISSNKAFATYPGFGNWVNNTDGNFSFHYHVTTDVVNDGKVRFEGTITAINSFTAISGFVIYLKEQDGLGNANPIRYTSATSPTGNYPAGQVWNFIGFTDSPCSESDGTMEFYLQLHFISILQTDANSSEATAARWIDDGYENNDNSSSAYIIPLSSTIDGLIMADAADWYKVNVTAANTEINIVIHDFYDEAGDFDLYLYNSSNFTTPLASSTTSTNQEEITYNVTIAGWYYFKVVTYDGGYGFYDMDVSGETCNLSVSPTSLNFTYLAGSQSLSVTSNTSWTVTDNSSWITVSPSSGSNNGSITVSVQENTNYSSRSGTVTVTTICGTTQVINVIQDARPCILTVYPTSLNFTYFSGNQTVSVTSNTTWNVTDNQSWITVSPSSGSNNGTITVSVAFNNGAAREGLVTLSTPCGDPVNVPIYQDPVCELDVSSSSLTFIPEGGTQNVNVTSNDSWNVSDNASWVTVSPTSGNGNGSIAITANAYTGTSTRTATVTVSADCGNDETIQITQNGQPCNLTVNPTSLSFTSTAGTQNVSITSNSTWSVSDDATWITVSPTSGNNNGSIAVTVTANSGAQRTGLITVTASCGTTQTISVTQNSPCNLTVNPTSLTYSSQSSTQNVSITSNSTWTVSDDATWITVTPTSGSNNGSIAVSVTQNTGAQRTGLITVNATCGTSQTITVTQEAPCSLTVNPTTLTFTSSASSQNVSITSNSTWTVTDDATWITVTPTSGSNNGSITVNVTQNTGSQRTGLITVTATCGTSQTISVTQQSPCTLTINPTSLIFTSTASTQNVSITSNSTWTVSDDATWITVTPTSGSNNGSIAVSVSQNTGSQRTGLITVTASCGTTQTISVTQEGSCTLTVNPTSLSFTSAAGSQNVSIMSNSSWSVSDDATWITVTPTSGSNNGSITVSVSQNTGSIRTGTVTVTASCGTFQIIQVTQSDPGYYLTVTPSTLEFTYTSGSQTVNISSNTTWTVTDNAGWITVNPTSGSNNGTLTVSVTQNNSSARTGIVTVTSSTGLVQIVTVNQEPSCYLMVQPNVITFPSAGGTAYVDVTSYTDWNIAYSAPWITVNPNYGTGSATVSIIAIANTGAARTTVLTVTNDCGEVESITVNQDAYCQLSISPFTLNFEPSGGTQQTNVTSNSTWTVSENYSWISVSPTSGTNNGILTVTVQPNTGSARTGTITLNAACGMVSYLTIQQADGCTLSVSPNYLNYSNQSGTQLVSVTSNNSWTVTDNASWISVSPSSGNNNGTINVSVTQNTGQQRTGTITVTSNCGVTKYIQVTQGAITNKTLLYLKRGATNLWTGQGGIGSQWKEISIWQQKGYTVTTMDFSQVTITQSLLSAYSTVRINGTNGGRPMTTAEGQALYNWVLAGGNLFAEIPFQNMVPGISPFGVEAILGQNGGSTGTYWYFNGSPWIFGPVYGPGNQVSSLASECMDHPVLTPNNNFIIDKEVSGYPAIVHKSYGNNTETTKKVIIMFNQGWSHDQSSPGNLYQATIYQANNLDFLINCIDYLDLSVRTTNISGETLYAKLYPNPTTSIVTCSFNLIHRTSLSITLYDTHGRKMSALVNKSVVESGEYNEEFDLSTYPDGCYIIKIITDQGISQFKVVKQ